VDVGRKGAASRALILHSLCSSQKQLKADKFGQNGSRGSKGQHARTTGRFGTIRRKRSEAIRYREPWDAGNRARRVRSTVQYGEQQSASSRVQPVSGSNGLGPPLLRACYNSLSRRCVGCRM
jgi:hypothetical protein